MELAGEVGVTLLVPGGMQTAFFDGRPEQYRPGPDAQLNDPADVAAGRADGPARSRSAARSASCVVASSTEPSWP